MTITVDEMFNREREVKILETIAQTYPFGYSPKNDHMPEFGGGQIAFAELQYLQEQELIKFKLVENLDGSFALGSCINATKKGIDFLKKDGGLSSVLDVVTVKFNHDFIALITQKIKSSAELSQPQKRKFLDLLPQLRDESIKHLVMKLLDAGLENSPKLLPLLQSLLG